MGTTLQEKIDLLRRAIRELKQVTASYDGLPRVFCPHILGRKRGAWKVLLWQFDGKSSRPGDIPNWRDFDLNKLTDLSLRDGEWHRGWETGRRAQNAIDEIDTVVDPAHAAELRGTSPPHIPWPALQRGSRKK